MADEEVTDLFVGRDLVAAVGEAVAFVLVDDVLDVDVDVAAAELVDDLIGLVFGDAGLVGALDDEQGAVSWST